MGNFRLYYARIRNGFWLWKILVMLKMKYTHVISGTFKCRPNRFIAYVETEGAEEIVHVKNTGRCRELLVPGATVFLAVSDNPERKTRCDLIAVLKERPGMSPLLINMDSQAPNEVAAEWLPHSGLFSPEAVIRREVTWGKSRFDFSVIDGERKAFLEVKGCTLEREGIASFPDAPTERGVKHIHELIACLQDGYEAYLLFVIQMKEMKEMWPNDEPHRAFGDAIRQAQAAGVRILAMDCAVTPDTLVIDAQVPFNALNSTKD